jgi:hypothetical protein
VLDGRGQPVEDARVVDQAPGNLDDTGDGRWYGHTDEHGAFELHGLPRGQQVLVVNAEEHPELSQPVSLPSAEVVVRLADGASVEGVVLGPKGPLEGAQVQVLGAGRHGADAQAESDERGHFKASGLPVGEVEVLATAEGLVPSAPVQVHITEGQTAQVELHLAEGLTLSGMVVDDRGQPVPEATVEAYPSSGSRGVRASLGSTSATAGADGHFHLSGLADVEYRVFAYSDGLSQATPSVAHAGDQGVQLKLSRGGRVTGRVVSTSGQPIHRFQIDGQDFQSADGAFTVRDVAPQTTEVVIEGEFQAKRVPVQVQPGESTDVGKVVIDEGLQLRGRVLTADGRPAAGAQLTATPAGEDDPASDDIDGQHNAVADAQGNFTLAHLGNGAWEVVATAAGGASRPRQVQPGGPPLELTLEAAGELHGRFTFSDGTPVTDGVVDVSVGTVTQQGRVYGGAFKVSGVPAGTAKVVGLALSERYHQSVAQAEVELGPGQSAELDLSAQPDPAAGLILEDP